MSRKSHVQATFTLQSGPSSPPPPSDLDEYYTLAAGSIADSTTTTIPSTSSTTSKNRALDVDIYGGKKITYTNRYDRLEQLSKLHSRVGLGLLKFGMRAARGYKLTTDPALGLSKAGELLGECKLLDQRINTDKWYGVAARLLARDGTTPLLTTDGDDDKTGKYMGIKYVEYLPIKRTTILTSNVKVGSGVKDQREREKMNTIMGPVDKVVLNENQDDPIRQIYKRDRIVLLRLDPEGNEIPDIYGRNTLGIYGLSLLESLDTGGTIKNYLDMLWGFARAVGKHGYGRTIFNDAILEYELQNGKRSRKSAQKILDAEKEAYKRMGAEENIVGAGIKHESLVPTISSDGGILSLKESYEKDIAYAFLETEASSNKAEGTTFASAKVASQDTTDVMESIRRQVKREFEASLYKRHLLLLGYSEDEAGSIRIELDPLDGPAYTLDQLVNLQTMYPEQISPDQLLAMGHIRPPPPTVQGTTTPTSKPQPGE